MTRKELYEIYKQKDPIEWNCYIIKKITEYIDYPEKLKEMYEAMVEAKKIIADIRTEKIIMDEQFWNEEI